jgi:glucose/arabinose dehydrogenase
MDRCPFRSVSFGLLTLALPASAQDLAVELVAEGLTAPVHLEEPADGSGRRFIVQQDGVVRVLGADQRVAPEPFLDLRPRMLALEQNFDERGLRGFALHPNFARNGRVFATYSAPLRSGAPATWNYTRRVSEFTAKPGDLSRVDVASERVLLEIDWPSRKHNGGGLAFGPDGYVYVGLGDGGAAHGIGREVVWEAFNVSAEALVWDGLARTRSPCSGRSSESTSIADFPATRSRATTRSPPEAAGGKSGPGGSGTPTESRSTATAEASS